MSMWSISLYISHLDVHSSNKQIWQEAFSSLRSSFKGFFSPFFKQWFILESSRVCRCERNKLILQNGRCDKQSSNYCAWSEILQHRLQSESFVGNWNQFEIWQFQISQDCQIDERCAEQHVNTSNISAYKWYESLTCGPVPKTSGCRDSERYEGVGRWQGQQCFTWLNCNHSVCMHSGIFPMCQETHMLSYLYRRNLTVITIDAAIPM